MTAGQRIDIDLREQRLALYSGDRLVLSYTVSTAANGAGEQMGSECTPRGLHVIRAKIGKGQAINTVFAARRPTGEIYSAELGRGQPERDWILTRILWLSGSQVGRNRLADVDTMRRFIYIHGCPDELNLGRPGSHGCVRMRNDDVVALFERVAVGTRVLIHE